MEIFNLSQINFIFLHGWGQSKGQRAEAKRKTVLKPYFLSKP
jgi:hypothetical protein